MFGSRYFGNGGTGPGAGTGASAAEIWAYTLANGKSAAQNLIDLNAGISELLLRSCLDDQVQGAYTAGDACGSCSPSRLASPQSPRPDRTLQRWSSRRWMTLVWSSPPPWPAASAPRWR
jgi:hypothetical protein